MELGTKIGMGFVATVTVAVAAIWSYKLGYQNGVLDTKKVLLDELEKYKQEVEEKLETIMNKMPDSEEHK